MANAEIVNLVTGYTGQAHIKSEDDAMINQFFLGGMDYAINLEHSVTNTFNVECDVVTKGRFIRSGGQVELDFTTPSSGFYRYDGVYAVYLKNQQGIESAEIMYCEGTQSASQVEAQSNIGRPTLGTDIPIDTVDFFSYQLFEIAWNNEQAKTVTESATVRGNIDFFSLAKSVEEIEQETLFSLGEHTESWTGAGYITSLKKGIRFTMPLSKFRRFGTHIVTNYLRVTLRQNGSYILGDASNYVDILSNSTLTIKGNIVKVATELSTEMVAATNNDAVGISAIFNFEVVTD